MRCCCCYCCGVCTNYWSPKRGITNRQCLEAKNPDKSFGWPAVHLLITFKSPFSNCYLRLNDLDFHLTTTKVLMILLWRPIETKLKIGIQFRCNKKGQSTQSTYFGLPAYIWSEEDKYVCQHIMYSRTSIIHWKVRHSVKMTRLSSQITRLSYLLAT